ncbi:hypothetical protein CAPTEDRAFT_87486, partial [Capitella teleta]
IRLIDGQSKSQGRLEVFYSGQWGTVCDDGFGSEEALVTCRSLGYTGGVVITKSKYSSGSGQIWLDQVTCDGDEDSLVQCDHRDWGSHDCSHNEDVGVAC